MKLTAREIAEVISGELQGNPDILIEGITNSENPRSGHITFAQDKGVLKKLEKSEIECLIVPRNLDSATKTLIRVENPKLAWADLLGKYYPARRFSALISPLAFISPLARIGDNVTIEPFVYVGDNAEIGDSAVLRAQVFIGEDVVIGKHTLLHSGVKIYEKCQIGENVIIHAGSVVGADGFGYVSTSSGQKKVPQVGNVIVEDDVELGANVTIDRATIGSTRIGEGTKIDNLVQIAHNVTIGKHTVISAQTGISGSSKVGNFVTMGGKVGLGDHVEIGDWTMVGAGSGFPSGKKVPAKQVVFGEPARPYNEARRQIAAQLRSAETLDDLRELRKRVAAIETQNAAARAPH